MGFSTGHQWTADEDALLRRLASGECPEVEAVRREVSARLGREVTRAQVQNRLTRLGIAAGDVRTAYARGRASAAPVTVRPAPTPEQETDLELAQEEIRRLTSDLKEARRHRLTDEAVKREIIGLRDTGPQIPAWTLRPPSHSDGFAGAPCVARSDEHAGEVVDPAQIEGFNFYNLETYLARMRRMTESVIDLCENHVAHRKPYPGLTVFGLGDGMTGEIHEELARTNDDDMGPIFLQVTGARIAQLTVFADHFGQVLDVEVGGNHGRQDEKWSAKGGASHRNWDWLAAQIVRRHFEAIKDDRVKFIVPDGPDVLVPIYSTKFLATHGNQFRGGDGIIGPLGPITRGDNRKRARSIALGSAYDVLILGHFHRLMMLRNLIVNGSMKGLDEYAYQANLPPEDPMQALFLTHPTHGITISMPVFLGDKKAASERSWIGRAA